MRTETNQNSPIVKKIKSWKKDQAIISLNLEEMLNVAKDHEAISEQKIDGQSGLMDFNGEIGKFGTLGGVIYYDLPVLDEIVKILKEKGFHKAQIVGEMAGYVDGKIIPFNETESIIKNPQSDKTKVHWFPYQILSIDDAEFDTKSFEDYKKTWPQLKKMFSESKYVHPVKDESGDGPKIIKETWNQYVLKEKNEGIVVRLDNNKVYKVKPTYSYDLVIVAVGDKKGKNWPKKQIGMTLMAFMDKNKIFRTAGHIGTGWSRKEGQELYSWAQKNKVGEDDTYIWVKPEKIVEVEWERTTIKEMPSYEYSHGGYKSVGKKMSGTIVKPRFIRYRTDKSVTPSDLRLTQIPDWGERQMLATKIAYRYVEAEKKNQLEIGKKIEKEHSNIFDLFQKYLKTNNLDMPISKDAFYEMIAQAHLEEVSDYYDKLIDHVEPKE